MIFSEFIYTVSRLAVILCWFGFAAAFIFRKRPETAPEKKRDTGAMTGVALEGVGYAIVWMFRRSATPFLPVNSLLLEACIGILTIIVAVSSVWMTVSAVNTLGKQWAVAARVVEGHKLITTGPYALVRNPIYTGMFGMLIATGFAWSTWYGVVTGALLFWFGTMIRVKIEERLLLEAFGSEFDAYRNRVPALLPTFFSK